METDVVHLDTHVVVWLHAGNLAGIPLFAQDLLNHHEIMISPAVLLELQYLREIQRIRPEPSTILRDLSGEIGLQVAEESFLPIIQQALTESWTRDPFDRIITAQARIRGRKLMTKDDRIHAHYAHAIWDHHSPARTKSEGV